MENNKEKINSKKKAIIITLIIIFALSIIYIIYCNNQLKEAEEFYKSGYFYQAGDTCEFVIPIFSQNVKKYKIAQDCGFYYEVYKNEIKYSSTLDNSKKIKDEIFDLTFGLYILQRDNKGDGQKASSSKIEEEAVEYIENLYYKELNNAFNLSKKIVDDEIISKYKKENISVDEMKEIAQEYADSYLNAKDKKKKTSYQ